MSWSTGDKSHFTSVKFKNFKALKYFSLSLRKFNVLVGPNNSGKSTILGAFRILAEAMRKANSRRAELIWGPEDTKTWGYSVSLEGLPIASENIFSDYDDSEPAMVKFRLSNGNQLMLYFPEQGVCNLICETVHRTIRSPSDFKREYNASIGFVPILGPVDDSEPLYLREAARLALLTHRASRNFRNIWYHFPENFKEFRELIQITWPGMDIEPPEVDYSYEKPVIHMFCPENRIPREIYWAGFGFQVWCQMLTYITNSNHNSILLIDEPDIYLHSDLQRQLVGILKNLGPDILIATHSTEIIAEASQDDLIVIDKRFTSGKRIKDHHQYQEIFSILGSNLNPTLTQLAKSRRVIFVEGKDFQIISRFARKLQKHQVANRTDFAVIPVEGFNPSKVKDFASGIEIALGTGLVRGVIFDRDYRSDLEVEDILKELRKDNSLAHIHNRKEIENFLIVPTAIEKAIHSRIEDKRKRTGDEIIFEDDITEILLSITKPIKRKIHSKYLAKRRPYEKKANPKFDDSTIDEKIMTEFDILWGNFDDRMRIVPGKKILALLNEYLQDNYKISLSIEAIINSFNLSEIPSELIELINKLDELRMVNPE